LTIKEAPGEAVPFQPPGNTSGLQHFMLPFCLGMTAMGTQIIFLREFLVLFQGNELVIGILLSVWMLLSGLGAWLGKFPKIKEPMLPAMLWKMVWLAFLAMAVLFVTIALKNRVFPAGSMIGIVGILMGSFILLSPCCLLSGFLYTRIVACFSSPGLPDIPARVYAFESVGSLAGGILLNCVLVFFLEPFQALLIVFILVNAIVAFIACQSGLKKEMYFSFLICSCVLLVVLFLKPDKVTRQMLFSGQHVEYSKDTPYGNLVVTRSAEQLNFFNNGSLLFTTNDVTANEESVHYAMLQRSNPADILVVEGGISGCIREILKYQVREIHYVEINPWILKLGRKYNRELSDRRVSVFEGDARRFLGESHQRFDVVLLQVPAPSTLLSNRFYTVEFFRLLKNRMKAGAVCSLGFIPSSAYLGEESRQVQATLLRTLGMVFPNVIVIPGEKNYFLASDRPLSADIARLAAERNIPTDYVNENYLDDKLVQQRSKEIMQSISLSGPINEDFKPEAYLDHMKYWLSYFGIPVRVALLILLSLLLLWIVRSNPVQLGIMVTGFTASSIEILLIFIFQVVFGYLFLMIGIIILVFMGGLFLGSISRKFFPRPGIRQLILLQGGMIVTCVLVAAFQTIIVKLELPLAFIQAIILLLVFFTAILAGLQFQCSAKVLTGLPQQVAGSLYSADLLGSAAGALLSSALLIPLFGIRDTLWIIMGINILSGVNMFWKRNHSIVM